MIRAGEMLEKYYPQVLYSDYYLEHVDKDIRSIAVRALGRMPRIENLYRLIEYLEREDSTAAAREGLRNLLDHHPAFIVQLIQVFQNSEDILHNRLAEVLSNRIEYIITKLLSHERTVATAILNELISMCRVSEIIEF